MTDTPSAPTVLKAGSHRIPLGERTLLMGIVNVTPDSFSDGGEHLDADAAVAHGEHLVAEGADILDVGGESTRPGAPEVPADVETDRVVPVVEALTSRVDVPVSVDTSKAQVAEAALDAGATMVNDVTALTASPGIAKLAAEHDAGLVLMHMQGTPRTMQADPTYDDVVREVRTFLSERAQQAQDAGIPRDRIVVDPGIGFGKTLQHNLALLRNLPALRALGHPILVGHSRKSFIGDITGAPVDDRVPGTLAVSTLGVAGGADILRVHDVAENRQAVDVADALIRGGT